MQIFFIGRKELFENDIECIKKSFPNDKINVFSSAGDAFWEIEKNELFPKLFFVDFACFEKEIDKIDKKLLQINNEMSIIYLGTEKEHLSKYGMHILTKIDEKTLKELAEKSKSSKISGPKNIKVVTFGNFDVFVSGKAVHFKRNKSKEILAYLINKNGTSVTHAELAAALWEDEEYDRSHQKQLQVIIGDLQKSLDEANIGEILIKQRTGLMVNKSELDCDYYNFLNGDQGAISSFCGEYMSAYSWAEITEGFLFTRVNDMMNKKQ